MSDTKIIVVCYDGYNNHYKPLEAYAHKHKDFSYLRLVDGNFLIRAKAFLTDDRLKAEFLDNLVEELERTKTWGKM
jgi:hypothetical protein